MLYLFIYLIFQIALFSVLVNKQETVGTDRCWRKLCVANSARPPQIATWLLSI